MRWRELNVVVDGEAVDAVSEVLRRWAPSGVAIIPSVAPGEKDEGVVEVAGPVRVVAYLAEQPGIEETVRAAEEALGHLDAIWPIHAIEYRSIDDADYADAWKAHYHTFRVGRHFVVKPQWEEYTPEADDVIVELDPGVAFGTGHHPTTQMCLRALEQVPVAGARVLDLGTGSGILAIGAAKLGAAYVLALDVDPLAVSAARQNVAANRLDDRIRVEEGSLPFGGADLGAFSGWRFDVVVANIIARVIVDLADHLAGVLAPNGILIASGIIDQRADEVIARLASCGLRSTVMRDGDWVTLIATRGKAEGS